MNDRSYNNGKYAWGIAEAKDHDPVLVEYCFLGESEEFSVDSNMHGNIWDGFSFFLFLSL